MVRFILTKDSNKLLTGFILERWITKTQDKKYPTIKLYKILCLDKSLAGFTIIEELIVEKT
jgi:hypothetical protein